MSNICDAESQAQKWFEGETKKGLVDIKFFLGSVSNTTSSLSLSKEFVDMITSKSLSNPFDFERKDTTVRLSEDELEEYYTDLENQNKN